MMMGNPNEMLKAMLPAEGQIDYKVFTAPLKGEQGQWLFIAIKLPEAETNDLDSEDENAHTP